MKKVYLFWIGDHDLIKGLVDKLETMDLSVEIGPSVDDHNFLYNNYPYYKKSYDQKIWSFCSDVWRLHKLSKNEGIYIDTSVEIGKDFMKLVNDCGKYDTVLFKETSSSIASSILFSNKQNNPFFREVLDLYKKDVPAFLYICPILPNVLSVKIKNDSEFYGFNDTIIGKKIAIFGLDKIRDKRTIKKLGSGSWRVDAKEKADTFWDDAEAAWNKCIDFAKFKRNYHKYMLENSNPIQPIPQLIKHYYEISCSKDDLRIMEQEYKKIKSTQKVKIADLLIWSKFNRFFTFKWLSIK